MAKNFDIRYAHAERMVALAEYMNIEQMTPEDVNKGIDCMVVAYEQSAYELPALSGYAVKNLLENPPAPKDYLKALTALKKHMQKWAKMKSL